MLRTTLSPRADNDVREIWRYTTTIWSERQAQAYVDALFDQMEALAENPRGGHPADEISEGLRKQRCSSHTIFYREQPDGILVVRVLHSSMDFATQLADNDS